MKNILVYADEYLKKTDLRDFAAIKIGACSAGVLFGLALPKKIGKFMAVVSLVTLVVTCLPQITKFFDIVLKGKIEE